MEMKLTFVIDGVRDNWLQDLCGCAAGSSTYIALDAQLSTLESQLGVALTSLDTSLSTLSTVLSETDAVIAGVDPMIAAVDGIKGVMNCGRMSGAFDPAIEPMINDLSGGLAGLALAMACCAGLSMFFMASIIPMQVYFGHVGREPGCQSCCRCCCGSEWSGGKNPDTEAKDFDTRTVQSV